MCATCLLDAKKRQWKIETTTEKAKQSAVDNQKTFIVYETSDGHIGFTSEQPPNGSTVIKIVTKYR